MSSSPVLVAGSGSEGYVIFDGVGKSYDGRTLAVRDVSLNVRQGEFFTFLGPSGSGKTSSLMMLAGFEAPTVGDIRLAGRSLTYVAPYDRNIGLVFQNYALFPHMTVAENVAFPLKVRRLGRAAMEEKVRWILSMVRLDALADRHPSQLSGGQQQRVALARALVFSPALVLMDEPLGALDRQLREHLQIEIRRIQQEIGATVVFVTHDQGEALSMSDRIAVFNNGMLQQADTPETIYNRPANEFVAGFLGDSIRIQGRVSGREGAQVHVDVPGLGRLRGSGMDAGGNGSDVIISLRPEDLRPGPAEDQRQDAIEADVADVAFLGDQLRVGFSHPAIPGLFTRLPASARGEISAQGSRMALHWQSEKALVYAAG